MAQKEEEAEMPADEVASESYMTVGQADASVRKNVAVGGEVVSLREQLKRAEEKARQVQREVRSGLAVKLNIKLSGIARGVRRTSALALGL